MSKKGSTRRAFLHATAALPALSLGFLILPLAAVAQQPARIRRVGIIAPQQLRDAVRKGLVEHGWIEGKNIVIESRSGGPTAERYTEAARELGSLKVECIVAGGNLAINAIRHAIAGIPIVMAQAADPIGSGFVASLRQPGGNITGLTNINEVLTGKRLELLKELNPRISRIAVLRHPAITAHDAIWKQAQSSAESLRLKIFAVEYRSAEDFETAFAAIASEKAEGLLMPTSPVALAERARIVGLAAKARLPTIYQNSPWVEAGGLMSYGPDETDMWRRSAGYVDKILKGAKAAELPVEQPTKFELTINMKTAKALGITIPQSVLVQATEVIQ